jgi:hypothetical protein
MSKKAGGAKGGGRAAEPGVQVVARNKKAGFDFTIEERDWCLPAAR